MIIVIIPTERERDTECESKVEEVDCKDASIGRGENEY